MKFPRVLFTVRRMMVAVAIVALICGAEIMRRCRNEAVDRFEYWSDRETSYRAELAADPDFDDYPEHGRTMREEAEEACAMRIKWEYAVHHPWCRFEPDPYRPE
jgi:hypothetical protein